jgi:hypothetical protein
MLLQQRTGTVAAEATCTNCLETERQFEGFNKTTFLSDSQYLLFSNCRFSEVDLRKMTKSDTRDKKKAEVRIVTPLSNNGISSAICFAEHAQKKLVRKRVTASKSLATVGFQKREAERLPRRLDGLVVSRVEHRCTSAILCGLRASVPEQTAIDDLISMGRQNEMLL